MAGETEQGPLAAQYGPEVVDLTKAQVFDMKPQWRQPVGHELLTAQILRCYRRSADQFTGQVQSCAH